MNKPRSVSQPQQRLPYSKKTKKWRKDNLDYADGYSFYNNEKVRKTIHNRIINQNLYNGILNMEDLNTIVNPYKMEASFIPDQIPHHPIIVPKIDLLLGEEMKRVFDYQVTVTNQNAISEKESDKKDELMKQLTQFLQSNYQGDQLEERMNKMQDYFKYEWQDVRERMGNQILKHYSQEQGFKNIFNDCFKDALIQAEEMVQIEIVHDEPVMTKLNPLKVHSIRSGNSNKIEDSQIIIIEDHWSPGKIVDYFHEDLKNKDIDLIMDYNNRSTTTDGEYKDDYNNHTLLRDALDANGEPFMDSMFDIAEINGHQFASNLTDENGNIRVFRVYWKSLKKVKKVKYYNKHGETEYKYRSEEYKEDKSMGEESKTMWINEMWEGTKIGKDIYINMKPRDVQYNKISNPSYCHAGIIGQVFNTNQGKAVSLVDRMKNYQYMYDVMWDRLNKAISTNYGKIFELDLAKVPENWEVEKWLHFAIVNKIAVVDSFKEGNKGAATGKLAGGMNTQGGRSIDMETGHYIQQHVQMLEFIKQEMSEIAGVSRQREGQISNTETVGGVERSVNQSANITEYWFNIHENFKLRALEAFLETAKEALKGDNKKVQYILDDLSIQMLNIDGKTISEADYGLVCTNSAKATELEQNIKQLSQAFVQNGGGISTIMDIYMADGLAEMRNKVEAAEEKINKRNAKQAEDQNKLEQQKLQVEQEKENRKLELEQMSNEIDEMNNIRDNETKRYIADMKEKEEIQDEDDDGIADPIEEQKLDLDREKVKNNHLEKIKDLNQKMKMHKDKMEKEDKKIAVSRSKNNSK